jgi:hypothetical protein
VRLLPPQVAVHSFLAAAGTAVFGFCLFIAVIRQARGRVAKLAHRLFLFGGRLAPHSMVARVHGCDVRGDPLTFAHCRSVFRSIWGYGKNQSFAADCVNC